MMIEFRRLVDSCLNQEDCTSRISIEATDIVSIHEGHGGVTIVTTRQGKVAVGESYEDAVASVNRSINKRT